MSDNGQGFKDRIVGFGRKAADQFLAHENNPRRHPQFQRQVVNASLRELGWVAPVVENVRTGRLLDGHERIWQALQNGGDVPYVQVDIAEAEEPLFLASFDYMTGLAEYDAEVLDSLLREVQTGDAALQQMLADLATENGLYGSITIPDPEPQKEPMLLSDHLIEIRCSAGDLAVFHDTLDEWAQRLTVTIDIS